MMTVAELFQWVAIRQWGEFRVTQLETMLAEQYTLLPIDLETCRWWGKVRAKCRQLGRPISPQSDGVQSAALSATWQSHALDSWRMVVQRHWGAPETEIISWEGGWLVDSI
jgi:hypothetical protein